MMIVDKIIIIDHDNGEAGEYSFAPGPNLLVSQKNTQGKSSLLKTLYYGLGFDIKVLPADWEPKKMTIKLDLTNEKTNEKLYVVRRGDLFYVPDVEGSITAGEYTKWLSNQLDADMKLPIKLTKVVSSVTHPSALILPFYVDQDESWSGRLFSSTNEVNMYSNIPERIFEYILGITDDDESELKEKRSILSSRKKTLGTKRKNINDVYIDYVDQVEPAEEMSSIFNPQEANSQSIETFITLMDEANKRYIEHKATRIKLQRELDQGRKTLDEYKTIKKMHKSDYDTIKCICKNCKSELTEEQVRTRMKIDTDIFELSFLIATVEQDIKTIEDNLNSSLLLEKESNLVYVKLSTQVTENKELKSIADYIEEGSKKRTQEEFASIIQKLDQNIGEYDADIKELDRELRESYKEIRARVGDIAHSFSDYVNDLSTIMVGSNVSNFDFKTFKVPESSGVHVNQAYLGAYLAYMKLVSEYGRYTLPFCIDSIIKNETAQIKSEGMFEAMEKYLMNLKGQSIFSAIQESVDNFMQHSEKYNRIDLGEKLLSADIYKASLEQIENIVVVK